MMTIADIWTCSPLGDALNYGSPEASPLKSVWFTPARRHRLGFIFAQRLTREYAEPPWCRRTVAGQQKSPAMRGWYRLESIASGDGYLTRPESLSSL